MHIYTFLDNEFSTKMIGHSRTLMGDSLAGTLALMAAVKYPHTFGRVIMQSPYIDKNVLNLVYHSKTSHLIDIYHTVGAIETAVTTTTGDVVDFTALNRELKDLFTVKEMSYQYKEIPLGKHTWRYWQEDLPSILVFMLQQSF